MRPTPADPPTYAESFDSNITATKHTQHTQLRIATCSKENPNIIAHCLSLIDFPCPYTLGAQITCNFVSCVPFIACITARKSVTIPAFRNHAISHTFLVNSKKTTYCFRTHVVALSTAICFESTASNCCQQQHHFFASRPYFQEQNPYLVHYFQIDGITTSKNNYHFRPRPPPPRPLPPRPPLPPRHPPRPPPLPPPPRSIFCKSVGTSWLAPLSTPTSLFANLASALVKNVYASPLALPRAVRPIRWM